MTTKTTTPDDFNRAPGGNPLFRSMPRELRPTKCKTVMLGPGDLARVRRIIDLVRRQAVDGDAAHDNDSKAVRAALRSYEAWLLDGGEPYQDEPDMTESESISQNTP